MMAMPERCVRHAEVKVRVLMKTCLVVDDSSVIRKVARRILEGLDFQIIEAEDGQQALEPASSRCRTRSCSTGTCRRWTATSS